MLTSESETAETLNFFSNIIKKLNILTFNSKNSVTKNIKNPVFKAILNIKITLVFLQFKNAARTEHFISKKIIKLDKSKASQKIDIPTRIIKKNIDIFADFL